MLSAQQKIIKIKIKEVSMKKIICGFSITFKHSHLKLGIVTKINRLCLYQSINKTRQLGYLF